MPALPSIQANLQGFFPPDFVTEERVLFSLTDPADGGVATDPTPTQIFDARALQSRAQADATEAEFFERHGFVLIPHESRVRSWDLDPARPEAEQDPVRIYHPEAEALVRNHLLPDRTLELFQGPLLRRGPGTPNPLYGSGVHQDYGLLPDDFQEMVAAYSTPEIGRGWRERFERDDVEGFMVIDFWRPVYLQEPLKHMPLALCEAGTARIDDCVPVGLFGITPNGLPSNQLGLRRHPGQRWYYYPGMTANEVLAFKNYQFFKSGGAQRVEACFHGAFEEPGCPPDVKLRQSCEHRVQVFLLAD